MSEPTPISVPCNGRLNTADPESALPLGTLVQATDTAHRWIGPRNGRTRGAYAGDKAAIARSVYELDAVDDYFLFYYNSQQMVLGLEWTLDLVVEPTGVGSTSGTIFAMGNAATHTDIHVRFLGSGSGPSDERKIRATVQSSSSSAASGSAVTVTDSTQRTLASAGTPATDPLLIYQIRLVRNGADLSLKVNGTETTGTGLSTTVGHNFVGDGFYLGTHMTNANTYLGGWIYKGMLRSGVFNDLSDAWIDTPHTRSPCVLWATTGGQPQVWAGGSSGFVQELSRFKHYGSAVANPGTDTLSSWPFQATINGIGNYTDKHGQQFNLVCANGRLWWERAT